MSQTTIFVSKHKSAQLPLKYMRLSVSSLFHKNTLNNLSTELGSIDKQFKEFIETPIQKN